MLDVKHPFSNILWQVLLFSGTNIPSLKIIQIMQE